MEMIKSRTTHCEQLTLNLAEAERQNRRFEGTSTAVGNLLKRALFRHSYVNADTVDTHTMSG